MKRNLLRLVKHLKKMLTSSLSALKLTPFTKSEDIPPRRANLEKSAASFTNYLELCSTCKKHQCQFNFLHDFAFKVSRAIHEGVKEGMSKYSKSPDE